MKTTPDNENHNMKAQKFTLLLLSATWLTLTPFFAYASTLPFPATLISSLPSQQITPLPVSATNQNFAFPTLVMTTPKAFAQRCNLTLSIPGNLVESSKTTVSVSFLTDNNSGVPVSGVVSIQLWDLFAIPNCSTADLQLIETKTILVTSSQNNTSYMPYQISFNSVNRYTADATLFLSVNRDSSDTYPANIYLTNMAFDYQSRK